jgi:hypothetical protein
LQTRPHLVPEDLLCDTPLKIGNRAGRCPYGQGVGTTGLIFAAIAIAWLAYLVPHFVRRRDDEPATAIDPPDRFSDSMRIVRHGTAPLLDQDLAQIPKYEVSTPQTRQAAIKDLCRQERVAASRRRRVLMVLLAGLSGVVGSCAIGLTPWWSLAIPGGLLLIFAVVARISVVVIRRSLDKRYRQIRHGSNESTIFLSREDLLAAGKGTGAPGQTKSGPVDEAGSLWDPVPITVPTYVSKPLAPRTVRTIDLSGPGATVSVRPQVPVTADAPETPAEELAAADGEDARKAATA